MELEIWKSGSLPHQKAYQREEFPGSTNQRLDHDLHTE